MNNIEVSKDCLDWLKQAIETIANNEGFVDKVTNKRFNTQVYSCGKVIRIDIKKPLTLQNIND